MSTPISGQGARRSRGNAATPVSLARNFKRAGGTAEQYVETSERAILAASKRDKWGLAATAMSLADVVETVEKVWGKKARASIERTRDQRRAERKAALEAARAAAAPFREGASNAAR